MTLEQLQTLRTNLLNKLQVTNAVREKLDEIAKGQIILNPRMRSSLGKANYKTKIIQLNTRMLTDHPEEIEPTFAHELAHLIAPVLFGRIGYGHGRGWKLTMRMLGYAPERTHDLDTSKYSRKQKAVAKAKCRCSEFEIKPRRHKKILAGANYRCRKCKERLILIKE